MNNTANKGNLVQARYESIWDDGSICISTSCIADTFKRKESCLTQTKNRQKRSWCPCWMPASFLQDEVKSIDFVLLFFVAMNDIILVYKLFFSQFITISVFVLRHYT